MTLLDLAKKFDAANPPHLRARLHDAIVNQTEMSAADKAAIEELLALGEQMKELLGDDMQEFERRFEEFTAADPEHWSPAMAVLRALGRVVHVSVPLSRGTHLIAIAAPESIPAGQYEHALVLTRDGSPARLLNGGLSVGPYDQTQPPRPTPLPYSAPCSSITNGMQLSAYLDIDGPGIVLVDFWFLRSAKPHRANVPPGMSSGIAWPKVGK